MKRVDADVDAGRSDAQRLRHDPARRASLDARVHCYLSVPVALAAILFVLVAVIQLNNAGGIAVPWHRRFWRHGPPGILFWGIWAFLVLEYLAKLALAPTREPTSAAIGGAPWSPRCPSSVCYGSRTSRS